MILDVITENLLTDIVFFGGWRKKSELGKMIPNPQTFEQTVKKHDYPGYIAAIKKAPDKDFIRWMRRGCKSDKVMLNSYLKSLRKAEAGSKFEKVNMKLFIDRGITSNDIELSIKWYDDVVFPALDKREKELDK